MSTRLEIYYNLLKASLEQYAFAVAGLTSVSAILLGMVVVWSFAVEIRLPKVPIAMKDEVPDRKERIGLFVKETRKIFTHGYQKFQNQVYGVTTTEGTNIVIPLNLLDGLGGQKSLSFSAFLEDEFSMRRYTKVGNLSEKEIAVVNKKLNPSLPQYTPVIQQLVQKHWPLEEYKEFSTVTPWPHAMRLVSRVSARLFHSADAADNDHWLDIASEHVHSTVMWTENLKKWPVVLRPFVYRFVDGRGIMVQRFREGMELVSQTLENRKANKGRHLSDPPTLLDYLAEGEIGPDDVEKHTITQINLCVAAIQSMAATVTQCLVDLASYPEHIPELLAEIDQALKEGNGQITKKGLSNMLKLDSFIKETQRLNPPDLTSFQRKALSDVTLSNGLHVPKGARIVLPTGAINMDREFFEDPEKFDGFRYYRLRTAADEFRNSSQMTTVGKRDLSWGYGRNACPGRYIAEVVMKLLVIEFIRRYEITLPKGVTTRPKNVEFEGLIVPDPKWELCFRSRK